MLQRFPAAGGGLQRHGLLGASGWTARGSGTDLSGAAGFWPAVWGPVVWGYGLNGQVGWRIFIDF